MIVIKTMLRKEYIEHGFAQLADEFEKNNKNIHINIEEAPALIDERRICHEKDFNSIRTYDLIYLDPLWIPYFVSRGWLEPFNEYVSDELKQRFYPQSIEDYTLGKALYALPIEIDVGMLFYRKDKIKKESLPHSWDELKLLCLKNQRIPALWGYTWQGACYEGLTVSFLEMLWGLLDKNTQRAYSTKEMSSMIECVITRLVDYIHDSCISPKEVLSFHEFNSGEHFVRGYALFHRNWPGLYIWGQKEISSIKGNIGILSIENQSRYFPFKPARGGLGFAVSAFSSYKKEAMAFIKYITLEQSQKILHNGVGIIPANKHLHTSGLFDDEEFKKVIPLYLSSARRPMGLTYASFTNMVQKNITSALHRRCSPRKAAHKIEEHIQTMFEKGTMDQSSKGVESE